MLLECVPNFSEGRDQRVLDLIATAICSVPEVMFLGMDRSAAAHRTVMTFAGPPQAVCEAAFRAIETARIHIDMRHHQGVHPRIGATDVCPLIPLRNITMDEAIMYACQLGKRVGESLAIPTYLYHYAAQHPDRFSLADIRRGGYEALAGKLRQKVHIPDFGPAQFKPQCGATVIGARNLMIAYNIDVEHGTLKLARDIARKLRESGGKTRAGHQPGFFQGLKAIGWYLPEEDRIQVSTNIMNLGKAPLHKVFEQVRKEARAQGAQVTGSELIGLLPRQILEDAGEFYLAQNPEIAPSKIEAGVTGLGLNHRKGFSPAKHILENGLHLAQNLLIPSLEPTMEPPASTCP